TPLLVAGKVESATIRVENIVREDLNVKALEMAELYCELLIARAGLIDQSRVSAKPIEVRELSMLRDMLTAKYGKELVREAMDNAAGLANEKLVRKLSADTPPDSLIKMYLTEIASFYHVKWRPDGEDTDDDDDTPGGGLAETAPVTPIASESESSARPAAVYEGSGNELGSDMGEALPSVPLTKPATAATAIAAADEPETEGPAAEPPIPLPTAAALSKPPATQPAAKAKPLPQQSSDGGIPSLEDLQRRFEALKRA
ncbi:Vacuolar protein sorting-associated protein ist1, partial [Coemansia sp. 'formosensis']